MIRGFSSQLAGCVGGLLAFEAGCRLAEGLTADVNLPPAIARLKREHVDRITARITPWIRPYAGQPAATRNLAIAAAICLIASQLLKK